MALLATTSADVTGNPKQGILEHRDGRSVFLRCGKQTTCQRTAYGITPLLRHPLAQPPRVVTFRCHCREFLERLRHFILREKGPIHFSSYFWHEYLRVVHEFLEISVEPVLNLLRSLFYPSHSNLLTSILVARKADFCRGLHHLSHPFQPKPLFESVV